MSLDAHMLLAPWASLQSQHGGWGTWLTAGALQPAQDQSLGPHLAPAMCQAPSSVCQGCQRLWLHFKGATVGPGPGRCFTWHWGDGEGGGGDVL